MRNKVVSQLYEVFKNVDRTILLVGDLGHKLFDKFKENFPDRFINCGIAQQNMIGLASGLALSGWKVYVYSIATFPTIRCLQQIRNDVVYHKLDVNIIATSGLTYGKLGFSHHTIEDVAILRSIGGIQIYSPADEYQAIQCVKSTVNRETPSYTRITNNYLQCKTQVSYPHIRNVRTLGFDKVILVSGGILSDVLNNKIFEDYDIYSMPFLTSIDEKELHRVIDQYSEITTIEQHNINGGLGTLISEFLTDNNINKKLRKIGTKSSFSFKRTGSRDFLVDKILSQGKVL